MRKVINLSLIILTVMILFAGCGTIDKTGDADIDKSSTTDNNTDIDVKNDSKDIDNQNTEDKETYTFEAQVIEGGTSILVTPDKDSNEIKSSDKITVSMHTEKIVGNDGKSIAMDELKPGDLVKITYNGVILESYPAQISASAIVVTGRNIVIDGYLALIDDIYKEDSGLNGDITMIALDTSQWTSLTDIDKEIIFQNMRKTYELDIIQGTFEELSEQGLIDKENLYFPKGILIDLKNIKYNDKAKTIKCSIKKWRSGLGAIGSDATAEYKDGRWVITKSNMWIS